MKIVDALLNALWAMYVAALITCFIIIGVILVRDCKNEQRALETERRVILIMPTGNRSYKAIHVRDHRSWVEFDDLGQPGHVTFHGQFQVVTP